jgi:hypothetical protein
VVECENTGLIGSFELTSGCLDGRVVKMIEDRLKPATALHFRARGLASALHFGKADCEPGNKKIPGKNTGDLLIKVF